MLSLGIVLYTALALLIIDAAIEVGLCSASVAYINNAYTYRYAGNNDQVNILNAAPEHFWLNQGHLSNASGGTALVLVGLGGIVALLLRDRANFHRSTLSKIWYHSWLLLTLLSTILTLSTLIYTFVLTQMSSNSSITPNQASLYGSAPYPDGRWTPEIWYEQILARFDLTLDSDELGLIRILRVMRAWRWNLILLFVLGAAVCVLAVLEAIAARRRARVIKSVKIPYQYS